MLCTASVGLYGVTKIFVKIVLQGKELEDGLYFFYGIDKLCRVTSETSTVVVEVSSGACFK